MHHFFGPVMVLATVLVCSLGSYLWLGNKALLVRSSYETEHKLRTCRYYHPPARFENRTTPPGVDQGCKLIVGW
ncbi:MAG: hypothetical protein JWN07_845 [Hyphomicrobiales bacterium]|nr:hypothetical protein [Hyphomicrobiales bacterium]